MSKSTIVLIVTWILIGLAGAFLGGYFWEKKVCKNAITNSEKSNVVAPSSTTNDSNKTVTQPNGTTPSTPASNSTDKTAAPATQQK